MTKCLCQGGVVATWTLMRSPPIHRVGAHLAFPFLSFRSCDCRGSTP